MACFIVAGLSVLLGAANHAWMVHYGYLESGQPQEYAANRLLASEVFHALAAGDLKSIYFFHGHHGPMLPIMAAIVAAMSGDAVIGPMTMLVTTGWLGVALTILGVYRLSRCWVGRGASILACTLVAASPVVVCYLRAFFHQGLLCALVLLTWAELMRTKGFTKRGATIRFAILAGASLLMKNLAPLYLAGPVTFELIRAGMNARVAPDVTRATRVVMANVVMAWCIVIAMTMGWITTSVDSIREYIEFGKRFEIPDHTAFGIENPTWSRWLYHPLAFINSGIGVAIAAVAVIALVLGRAKPTERERQGLRHALVHVGATYVVIAMRQPVLESTFCITWAPVLAFCVAIQFSRSSAIGRRIIIAASVVALTVNAALFTRGPLTDRTSLHVGPIEVVAQFDHYLVAKTASVVGDLPSRGAPWPFAQFAFSLARAGGGQEPHKIADDPSDSL